VPFLCGLDLANIRDVAAAVFLFPMEDGRFFVTQRFWVPKENMEERVRKDRVPYDAWVRDGWMTATPGDVIDYAWIEKEILDFAERYQPKEIAFDPWNATQITTNLQEKDLTVVPVRQGFASMSPPMKQLEALIFQGRIVHDGNPVMRWMVDNVTATMDPAGNIKPDKGKSREKIDGVVALIMAVSRALFGEEEGPSVYEEREPVVI